MDGEVTYRLYNGAWSKELLERKKYQDIRDKIVSTFSDLEFEEGPHKYYLNKPDGTRVEVPCVSNVTHLFKPAFDTDEMARKTFDRNYDNPDSKYYRMSVNEIKETWTNISRKACSHGTERHEFAESCFYFMCYQYDKILDAYKDRLKKDDEGRYYFEAVFPKEIAAAKFYHDLGEVKCIIPILAETKVYIMKDGYYYSGTFDLLTYYDQSLDESKKDSKTDNSGLIVNDWKSNKDLYKCYPGSKLLYEFSEFDDMPLNVYKLQLSAYQNALENIGFKIVGRRIMWLLPDGTYSKISLENLVKIFDQALKKHFDIKHLL